MSANHEQRNPDGHEISHDSPYLPGNWSRKRTELLKWFRVNAKSLADSYEGAVKMLEDRSFPGRVHFIGHAVRDIADRLGAALELGLEGGKISRVQHEKHLDPIAKDWPELQTINEHDEDGVVQDRISIEYNLAIKIDSLVSDHRARRKRRSNSEHLFRYLMRKEPTKTDVNMRLVSALEEVRGWFMEHTHFRADKAPVNVESELQSQFRKFEEMLYSFVGNFFTIVEEIDEILRESNHEDIDAVIHLLSSPQHEAYFFSRLEDPKWISGLAERSFFKHPPSTQVLEGGNVSFPRWPASQFLVRMAPKAPDEVADLFLNLFTDLYEDKDKLQNKDMVKDTDNPLVIGDMVNAALAMPAEVAAQLAPIISKKAREEKLWFYFKDASDLCVRLAKSGKKNQALKLAEALFTPRFEEGQQKPRNWDEYWYENGLAEIVPPLAKCAPLKFTRTLCHWLKKSVDAKLQINKYSESSYLWRPAVEEHEKNGAYDLSGIMVGFVRHGFEVALQSEVMSLDEALRVIERFPLSIFKRIRIHLITLFGDQNAGLARQAILNHEFFINHEYEYEYAMLVDQRLDLLLPNERAVWFGWIDVGPDMSHLEDSGNDAWGLEVTDEERQKWLLDFQLEKLHWARNHLHGGRREFYDELLSQFGEPEFRNMTSPVISRWEGDDSPITVEQFAEMTFDEAVEASTSWQPDEWMKFGRSTAALAEKFKMYVATNPEEFSAKAEILIRRPAIFVSAFIRQMQVAVEGGREIDLPPVLELCNWVVQHRVQKIPTAVNSLEMTSEEKWQDTRCEISRFIRSICRAEENDVPKYPMDIIRERIWDLIETLFQDQADSYLDRDTTKEDLRLHDYLDLAINSPRGKGVEAGLAYARWVAIHLTCNEGDKEIVPGGFEAMPEVREMLEWQISPENRSVEAMSIIGSAIGLIYWVDKQWLASNADRLFDLEEIERQPTSAHGWAAWNSFLAWVRPYSAYYRVLKSQFRYAVTQSSDVELPEQNYRQPMYYLGEHLLIMYARGQLGLDDDECLLRRFLEDSTPEIRCHAIGFIGRAFDRNETAPEDIIERLQNLWDYYWAGRGQNDAVSHPEERLFETWFSCGKFTNEWALDRLYQFAQVNPLVGSDHIIAEKLAEMASVDVLKSVQILDMFVRGDKEDSKFHAYQNSAKQICVLALNTPGKAKETAIELINYLGRLGYMDFGKLL